jgi:hypothetical protein
MIIPTRWQNVKTGMRVVDPAGQTFHVLPRFLPTLVQLRDRSGRTHTMAVDPNANVPTMLELHDIAVANLATAFPNLEYLGER